MGHSLYPRQRPSSQFWVSPTLVTVIMWNDFICHSWEITYLVTHFFENKLFFSGLSTLMLLSSKYALKDFFFVNILLIWRCSDRKKGYGLRDFPFVSSFSTCPKWPKLATWNFWDSHVHCRDSTSGGLGVDRKTEQSALTGCYRQQLNPACHILAHTPLTPLKTDCVLVFLL